MAITPNSITGDAWTPITSAGESGTCWLQNIPDKGQVVINHSNSGVPSAGDVDDSYFMVNNQNKIVEITADDAADVFYARCSVAGESAKIIADVI